MSELAAWMDANLAAQGYHLTPEQSRALRVGVRLSTGLCLALVVAGLAARSGLMILALVPIGIVAGWTARHPFDALWNHGLRHLTRGPLLPHNPPRRRHSFKIGAVWLLAIGLLLIHGDTPAALTLGALLVAVCGLLTATNICIPSVVLAALQRWRSSPSVP